MVSYCTYKKYLAKFDDETYTLTLVHTSTRATATLVLEGLYSEDGKNVSVKDFSSCTVVHTFDPDSPKRQIMLTFHPNDTGGVTFRVFSFRLRHRPRE